MNELQDMVHQSLLPSHLPPPTSQIQLNYKNSKTLQNKYQFPRKKQSITSSRASQELEKSQFYNLYWQNRNQRRQDKLNNQPVKDLSKNKYEQLSKTKILELKKIKQFTKRQSMLKKQKIQVVSNQNSPESNVKIIKKIDLIPHKNFLQTPTKTNFQPTLNSKTKSKKKILVMSAHKIRKIQNFKFQSAPTSPNKGLHLVSKQKKYGTQVRTINIF